MSIILRIKDPTNGTTVSAWKSYLAQSPLHILTDLPATLTRSVTPIEIAPLTGLNRMWSDNTLTVKTYDGLRSGYVLTALPITATVSGKGDATLSVERDGPYNMVRPDESTIDGYDQETIAIKRQNGGEPITINRDMTQDDLIGSLDDGATYKLIGTLKDSYGQMAQSEISFIVDWAHQALMPQATVEMDYDYNVAIITPIAPIGATEGDSVDIYRLSCDKPELIYSGAMFGIPYVDPYPTIGEFGGHRIVYRTKPGDYTTADNAIAWLDLNEDNDDILDIWGVLIDFDDYQLHLKYDIKLSSDWKKDFAETKYLGGAIQGDWNPAVSRTTSVTTRTIVEEDAENIAMLRRLANFPGVCHLRTPDGSSFACNIEVKEDREEKMVNKLATFTLSITRVDPEGFDMMTYDEWYEGVE